MKDKKRKYSKPKIKSSKIKTISFYGRSSLRSVAETEGQLAFVTSDKRTKRDIKKLTYGLNEVMDIKTWSYKKTAGNPDPEGIGIIAQELHKIMPEVVNKPAGKEQYWKINYAKIIPVLIKALQEQQQKVDQLEKKLMKLQQN